MITVCHESSFVPISVQKQLDGSKRYERGRKCLVVATELMNKGFLICTKVHYAYSLGYNLIRASKLTVNVAQMRLLAFTSLILVITFQTNSLNLAIE